MYPNFYYIFKDWFGIELDFLRMINSFGFFVAISFLLAGWAMRVELKRKFNDGILGNGTTLKYFTGKPFSNSEYLSSGITGFIFGFKILPLLLDFKISNRWQEKWWHLERSSCGMWDVYSGILFWSLNKNSGG